MYGIAPSQEQVLLSDIHVKLFFVINLHLITTVMLNKSKEFTLRVHKHFFSIHLDISSSSGLRDVGVTLVFPKNGVGCFSGGVVLDL